MWSKYVYAYTFYTMMQKQRNGHSRARYDDGQSKRVHVCIDVYVNCLFVQFMCKHAHKNLAKERRKG